MCSGKIISAETSWVVGRQVGDMNEHIKLLRHHVTVLKTWEVLSNISRGREVNESQKPKSTKYLFKSLPGDAVSKEEETGKVPH